MGDEEGANSDIIRLRAMAEERSEDDPLAAMALDGCADEITRLRKAAMPAPMSVAEAARVLLGEHYRCSKIPGADRTTQEHCLAAMGRNRLRYLSGGKHASPEGE